MPDNISESCRASLVAALFPLADQASRIFDYISRHPFSFAETDSALAARIAKVSAQQVAIVRRELAICGLLKSGHDLSKLKDELARLSHNFSGIAVYLHSHRDRDIVRLVLTEPGLNSALRQEINRTHELRPILFQTTDAFLNLAAEATAQLTVLVPFIDDHGADFLLTLFSNCRPGVRRTLICRPLAENHCGQALRRRRDEFLMQNLEVFEYALPSALPSRRETFHAKAVIADDTSYYVGSSNFMGSALERSLECGVIVSGYSARELAQVISALRRVATPVSL